MNKKLKTAGVDLKWICSKGERFMLKKQPKRDASATPFAQFRNMQKGKKSANERQSLSLNSRSFAVE